MPLRALCSALAAAVLTASLAWSAVALAPAARAQQDPAPLCQRIDALASDAHDRLAVDLGVVLLDLASGDHCEVRATRIYRSASLYKLIVLAEAYRQREEMGFDFAETIVLLPRHSIDDPPALRLTGPVELRREQALARMITFSDNSSAEALRELLGPALVAQAPRWLGLEQTSLGAIFYTSPQDMAHFFTALYRGEVVSPEASQEMLDLLLRQEINDLIPDGVAAGVPIAHKTGLLDRQLHDAGIVYSPGGDYVLIAMSEHQGDIDAAYDAIHELSALIFEGYAEPPPPAFVATPTPTPVSTPTATPTAAATPPPAAAVLTPTTVPPEVSVRGGPRGTSSVRTLLILGAAAAGALAAVSLIMLIARQRHVEPY